SPKTIVSSRSSVGQRRGRGSLRKRLWPATPAATSGCATCRRRARPPPRRRIASRLTRRRTLSGGKRPTAGSSAARPVAARRRSSSAAPITPGSLVVFGLAPGTASRHGDAQVAELRPERFARHAEAPGGGGTMVAVPGQPAPEGGEAAAG